MNAMRPRKFSRGELSSEPNWGQNKSCSKSYGKAEWGMNIKPLVGLALAAEAI